LKGTPPAVEIAPDQLVGIDITPPVARIAPDHSWLERARTQGAPDAEF
jgi:hypothetical protein